MDAASPARPWLEKFASILELTSDGPQGRQKLIHSAALKPRPSGWGKSAPPSVSTLRHTPGFSPGIVEGLIFTRGKPKRAQKNEIYSSGALRFWFGYGPEEIICDIGAEESAGQEFAKMKQAVCLIYRQAGLSGGIPLHSALIERDGAGALLAASGGIGKSTCCLRLPHPWQALCDDEALVLPCDNARFKAHPFPTWSNYIWRSSQGTWNIERGVDIGAIFFLERSNVDEAQAVGGGVAAAIINNSIQQVFFRDWQEADSAKQAALRKIFFHNACELAKAVPAFILRFTAAGRFWEKIEEALCFIKAAV